MRRPSTALESSIDTHDRRKTERESAYDSFCPQKKTRISPSLSPTYGRRPLLSWRHTPTPIHNISLTPPS